MHRRRQTAGRLAATEDGHFVAATLELSHNERADETGSTDDEDSHGSPQRLRRPATVAY